MCICYWCTYRGAILCNQMLCSHCSHQVIQLWQVIVRYIGLAFLNLHVYNLNKDQVFSCRLKPFSYRCEEKLLNYYNGMKNCHSKSPICFWDNLKNGNRKYWEPPTHRSPRFLAFFLHILTKNDRFLNLQVTVRRFSRRKLKILLSLISTNWTSCTIDVAISSDSRRPGKQSVTLISIKNRTVLTRYES